MRGVPLREVTSGPVTVRCWQPTDAALLHEAVLDSIDHLRPWMPWARSEPLDLDDRRALISEWIRRWDAGEEHSCAIVVDSELVGACGLHRRIAPDGLEIGYRVRTGRTGAGVATEAVRALIHLAFSLDGISHVEIHHDAANIASRRVPEKVGFTLVEERPDDVEAPGEVGIEAVWRLTRPAEHPR